MSKWRKESFYIRVSIDPYLDEFLFQKVSGRTETFQASDGTPVQFGFHRSKGYRWWYITEISTGLACGGERIFEDAENAARKLVDTVANLLKKSLHVQMSQELADYIRIEEEKA